MNPLNFIGSIFGMGLSGVGSVIGFAKNIPFIWKLIANYSTVKDLMTKAWNILEAARNEKGLPTVEQTRDLVQIARIIFEKELIDLPELDELRFAEQLRELEYNLTKAIANARREKLNE